MLYSLRSACTSVHSLYNCCISCKEARQTFRKRNHSNSPPQLTCLCSPTVTRKVKTRLAIRTELSFLRQRVTERGRVTLHLLVHLRRPGATATPGSHRSKSSHGRGHSGDQGLPLPNGQRAPETAMGCTQLHG